MTDIDTRPDGRFWFKRWYDAYHQAAFFADLTGLRYRVWYDPNNRWWNITELIVRHREP
jgi:hypothetical protein